MNTPRIFKKAAQQCLDERWYPMSKAKTVKEIRNITHNTSCALCLLSDNPCWACPMKSGSVCSKGFTAWDWNADFTIQHLQVLVVVAELEAIVKG